MSEKVKVIPEGYMMDARERLVPVTAIKTIDKVRDELVSKVFEECLDLAAAIGNWKKQTSKTIDDFCALSAAEYGVVWGGNKGNVTLTSYDGSKKIIVDIQETIFFDERLNAAKELIDACLKDFTEGGRDEPRVLIQDAFNVKDGRISIGKVLGLRKFDFKDERWVSAMAAINDSVQVAFSKRFLRVYHKNESGKMEMVPLDGGNI